MNINFKHEENNLGESLGLCKEDKTFCNINIIFSVVNNKLMSLRLYNDESDIPHSLKTISGELEGIVNRARKDAEIVYSCMQYHIISSVYKNITDAYVDAKGDFNTLYNNIKDKLPDINNENIDVKIIKMIENDDEDQDDEENKQEFIADIMKKLFGKENDLAKKKRVKEIFDIIKICDKSNGSFSNFYEETKDKNL